MSYKVERNFTFIAQIMSNTFFQFQNILKNYNYSWKRWKKYPDVYLYHRFSKVNNTIFFKKTLPRFSVRQSRRAIPVAITFNGTYIVSYIHKIHFLPFALKLKKLVFMRYVNFQFFSWTIGDVFWLLCIFLICGSTKMRAPSIFNIFINFFLHEFPILHSLYNTKKKYH